MFPTSTTLNKNQSLRYDLSAKSKATFNRTYTLPRRFKEKFLSNTNLKPMPVSTQPISQQSQLNKSVNCLHKSFKYLEQIMLKKKFEIISPISTAILECILDLYNQIKLVENTAKSSELKLNLNKNLANFIKWSDSILLYLSLNNYESQSEFLELTLKYSQFINDLTKSVQDLVDFILNKKIPCQSRSPSPESKTRSLSSSSSKNDLNQTKVTVNIEDKVCTKTVETQIESNLVQISTLTCTNKENVDLDTFFNLDKLAMELSELSNEKENSFTNDKCNYLLKQFETFAKEFSIKEKSVEQSPASCYSTLNRSYYTQTSSSSSATCYSSPNRMPMHTSKKKTLFKNSQFKHDLDSRVQLTKSLQVNSPVENVLSKSVDQTNRVRTNFIETNYINNSNLSKIILDLDDDEVRLSLGNAIVASQEANADLQAEKVCLDDLNQSQDSNELNPNFLLIDDEDDQEEHDSQELDDNNDVFIIVETDKPLDNEIILTDKDDTPVEVLVKKSGNLASFSSESMSNSSLSLSNEQSKAQDANKSNNETFNDTNISSILNINTNLKSTQSSLNSLNLACSPNQLIHLVNKSNETESSLSDSSHLSNSSQLCSSMMSPNSMKNHDLNVLSLLDVTHLLEYQSSSSISTSSLSNTNPVSLPNSSILRGGDMDALIVLATSASSSVIAAPATLNNNSSHSLQTANPSTYLNAHTNFLFQEAFLTTYRTILEPIDLIKKLICRYRLFAKSNPNQNQLSQQINKNQIEYNDKFDLNRLKSNIKISKMTASAVRNSLTLLVRVLDGLENELDDKELYELLTNFIFELVIDDELQMARLLRKKLIYKLEKRRIDTQKKEKNLETIKPIDQIDTGKLLSSKPQIIPSYLNNLAKRGQSILDFKSGEIAEQMTLIDLELFNKIELSEVLLWSTKQNEQMSPNLIKFTEHFNNISYWARSRILEPENYKDREKYLIKFLKIMKHLRKMNNFNSYLSILSAVDSGPIQRLDWPKNIIDTIKEFSTLIDPKCGFKILREAIAEAQPPCIPHIGLILQDLTILHIANPDFLPSGNCNFWKRWQQFNILERLRYFKRCNYNFKPNPKMQELFNNFQDYIGEDAQYSLSEQLKPRSKH